MLHNQLAPIKKELQSQERKILRKSRIKRIREANKKAKRFNFGKKNGFILTSTSNPKAHTYNKLMRRSDQMRNQNFQKMKDEYDKIADNITDFEVGFINAFKSLILGANETKGFRTVYLIKSKSGR